MTQAVLSFILILFYMQGFTQIIVDKKDLNIDTYDISEVGEELIITKKDSTLLSPNTYIYNYPNRDKTYPISFVINNKGKPDGIVACDGIFKSFVNNGIVYRFERYQRGNHALAEEVFMRGDTVIMKHYNRHGEKRSEYWKLNKETIYDYNCSYSSETDSIVDCRLRDDVKGLYISYGKGGKITSRTLTKGLPKGIREQTEKYDGEGKFTEKKIEYDNGTSKSIYANGNYTVTTKTTEGTFIEEYTRTGKLIQKYKEVYPSRGGI